MGVWMNIQQGFGRILKSSAPIAALCLFTALTGCEQPGKVERAMLREISRSCTGRNPCSIRIREFTRFDWDRAFFFNDATNEPDRSGALGTHEEGYAEFEDQPSFP